MAKILVIEDEQNMRNSLLEILTYEGFEVVAAENGRVGVQLAKEYHPDLILCDIIMPELNGYGVLLELRRDPLTATTPLILLTSTIGLISRHQSLNLGADGYLTKPFEIDEE